MDGLVSGFEATSDPFSDPHAFMVERILGSLLAQLEFQSI